MKVESLLLEIKKKKGQIINWNKLAGKETSVAESSQIEKGKKESIDEKTLEQARLQAV